MRVYVVMGTSGDYSDRREWVVIAHADEGMARIHVAAATERGRALVAEQRESDSYEPLVNEYDGREVMFDEPTYWVEDVEVVGSLADALAAIAAKPKED